MTVLLPPLILIPGVGGSKIDAVNKKNDKVERVWVSKDVLPVPQLGKKFVHYLWGRPDPETQLYTSYTEEYAETRTVDGLEGCWRLIDHWLVNTFEQLFKHTILGKYFVTIIGRLMQDYGYQPNKNLFGFSYDWRQPLDSECIRGELHKLVLRVRELNNGMPVNIIAHSLGGLVGRTYCQLTPDWMTHIRRFITIGTPFDGSSSMTLNSFINGYALDVPGMKLIAARGIQASSSVTIYLSNLPPLPPQSEDTAVPHGSHKPLAYLSNGLPYFTYYHNSCMYLKKIQKTSKRSKLTHYQHHQPRTFFEEPEECAVDPQKPLQSLLFNPLPASFDEEGQYKSSQFDTDTLYQDMEKDQRVPHNLRSHPASPVSTKRNSKILTPHRSSTAIAHTGIQHRRLRSDTVEKSRLFQQEMLSKRHSTIVRSATDTAEDTSYLTKLSMGRAIHSRNGSFITLKQNLDAPERTPEHKRSASAASSIATSSVYTTTYNQHQRRAISQRQSRLLNLSNIYITIDFSRYGNDVPDIGAILLGRFLSDPTLIADDKKKEVYQLLMKNIERKVIVKTAGIKKPRASGKSLDTLLLPNYKSKSSMPAIEEIANTKNTWKWESYSMWPHLGRTNATSMAAHPYFTFNDVGFPILRDDCPYRNEVISGILPRGSSFSQNKDLYLIATAQAIYTSTRQLTEPLYRTVLIGDEEKAVKSKLLNLEYRPPDNCHLISDTTIYKADAIGVYSTENKVSNKRASSRNSQLKKGSRKNAPGKKMRTIMCRTPAPWVFLLDIPERPIYNLLRQVTKMGTLEAYLFQPYKSYWKSVARVRVKALEYNLQEDVGSSQIMSKGESVFPMFTSVSLKGSNIAEQSTMSSMPSLTPVGSMAPMSDLIPDVPNGSLSNVLSTESPVLGVTKKLKQQSHVRPEKYLRKRNGDPRSIPKELVAQYPILSSMKPCTTDDFRFISINGGNIPTPMHTIYPKPINTYDELPNQLPVFIMGRGDGTVLLSGALNDSFDDALVHDRVVIPDVTHAGMLHDEAAIYLIYMGLGLPLQLPHTQSPRESEEQEERATRSVSS
ncbi:Phosphatidylcholine-sterol acyltransferase precursor [Giardia duodenalis]|uniref:Phosphatidylcholine-sterol acyltransferase n=1 Tax=Giardia intestinalis TaxID=5741 RepID=V6TWJ0_GIAIN|nr:Phosphatidylcholine-sterol acyltransferase precursor [Giardia intestinalis]